MFITQLTCNSLSCISSTHDQKKHSILFVALLIISLSGLVFFLCVHEPFYSFIGTKITIGILCASIPLLVFSSFLLSSKAKINRLISVVGCSHMYYSFEEWEPSLHPLDNQILEETELPMMDAIKNSLRQQFRNKIQINQYISLVHHSVDETIFFAICYHTNDGFFTDVFNLKENAASLILTLRKSGLKTIHEESDPKKIELFTELTFQKRNWILGKSPSTKCILTKKSYWPSSGDDFWWVITRHKSNYTEVRYYSSVEARDHYIELLEGYKNSYISWRTKLKQFD